MQRFSENRLNVVKMGKKFRKPYILNGTKHEL